MSDEETEREGALELIEDTYKDFIEIRTNPETHNMSDADLIGIMIVDALRTLVNNQAAIFQDYLDRQRKIDEAYEKFKAELDLATGKVSGETH